MIEVTKWAKRLAFSGVLSGLTVAPAAGLARAEEGEALTVQQIVEKANQVAYYQGGTGRAHVRMTMYDKKGNVRGQRELTILRRNVADTLDQKLYAYITKPADVNGTAFLVLKNSAKDDDRWLYNPALDFVNRIAATDKRASFIGTDFFYEDVSGRRIDDDTHELVQTTDAYYVLKNLPKDAQLVEFAYYLMYIDRQTFMPIAAYYYDRNDKKYREYQVTKRAMIDGYVTATQAVMRDLREKDTHYPQTVAEYSDVKYELDLPDDIFSERYLRKPPRDYLE